MRFAVFTVGLPEWTPPEALPALHDLGYDGIEWRVTDQPEASGGVPGFWAGNRCTWPLATFVADAPQIRTMTEAAGLQMPNVGTYVTCEDLAGVEQAMHGVSRLGVSQLRVNVPRFDGKSSYRALYDRAVGQYKEVATLAQRYSVRALIEIHHGTITPSATAASSFLSNFDPRFTGAIHDAGNMVYEGFEHYRMGLETLGPYLAHVHLKNAKWQPVGQRPDGSTIWAGQWAPIKAGIVDMPLLFRALHDVRYDGWVSFEDFSTDQPLLDRLRDNLAYIKQVVAHTPS